MPDLPDPLCYDFAAAERDQLLTWARLRASDKIDFFEEMVSLAYARGALRPERLALGDRAHDQSRWSCIDKE